MILKEDLERAEAREAMVRKWCASRPEDLVWWMDRTPHWEILYQEAWKKWMSEMPAWLKGLDDSGRQG